MSIKKLTIARRAAEKLNIGEFIIQKHFVAESGEIVVEVKEKETNKIQTALFVGDNIYDVVINDPRAFGEWVNEVKSAHNMR